MSDVELPSFITFHEILVYHRFVVVENVLLIF